MVTKLNLVAADIKKALFDSFKGGTEAKRINKLIDNALKLKSSKEQADAILCILQKELPHFLISVQNGAFRSYFEKIGLPIKVNL